MAAAPRLPTRRARDRLREALAGFERLGAQAWAAQTRNELQAAGARRRVVCSGVLTSAGCSGWPRRSPEAPSNREIATELFLAPKTVESHLSQIYRKLGVGSRTQLVAALTRAVTPEPSPDAE